MTDPNSGEPAPAELDRAPVHIRTFLIADIRGYTAFTRDHGDEAAAALATEFARLMRVGVADFSGQVLELRGDEALVAFPSTRQALRAAVDLQLNFARVSEEQPDLPLAVGIGLDAGEAVPVEGGYRGAALNMAARLCSVAGPREILATEAVTHLAGTVTGLRYVPRRLKRLKGMTEPVRAVQVTSDELDLLLPALPAPVERSAPGRVPFLDALKDSDWSGFGEQISSMVEQHLQQVNEEVKREVGREIENLRPGPRPVTPPLMIHPEKKALPIDVTPRKRRVSTWFVPVLGLAVIVIAVIVIWALVH